MIIRQHTHKDVNSIEVMLNSFQLTKKKKLQNDICSKIVLLVIIYLDEMTMWLGNISGKTKGPPISEKVGILSQLEGGLSQS